MQFFPWIIAIFIFLVMVLGSGGAYFYRGILAGQGFGLTDAAPSIALVHDIREAEVLGLSGEYHPLAALPQAKHPFK